MEKKIREKLFSEWLRDERKKLISSRINTKEFSSPKRGYIHFDKRRKNPSFSEIKNSISNPAVISQIGFWPFIKDIIPTPRYKKKKHKDGSEFREIDLKKREVFYAAHKDALIYSWYAFLLTRGYYEQYLKDKKIERNVLSYRKIPIEEGKNKNKCNIHFAEEVFRFVRDKGKCATFVSDISSFFDTLDHEHLKKEWCRLLGVEGSRLPVDHYTIYRNLTEFKYVDLKSINKALNVEYLRSTSKISRKKKNGKFTYETKIYQESFRNGIKINSFLDFRNGINPREEFFKKIACSNLIKSNNRTNKIAGSPRAGKLCGIMQGAPISAVLSNIYMMSFDEEISHLMNKYDGIYRRYSDDIFIACNIDDLNQIKTIIQKTIKKYELTINDNKTDVTFFLQEKRGLRGFADIYGTIYKKAQYLGFEFDGQRSYIRGSSVSNYYRKMKRNVGKAVNMAYSKQSKSKKDNNRVFKKRLCKRFLYQGRRSFISYALRASSIMNSQSIRRQLLGRFEIFRKALDYRIQKKEQKIRRYEYARSSRISRSSNIRDATVAKQQ